MALTVIACYDVVDNSRRARVAALLQAFGDRIQKSVFQLNVDEDEFSSIMLRVEGLIDLTTDSFYAFRQCGNCLDSLGSLGQTHTHDRGVCWIIV